MEWIKSHSTLLYALAVAFVILAGAVLISDKFSTQNTGADSLSWGTDSQRFLSQNEIVSTRVGDGVSPAFNEDTFFQHLANTRDDEASYRSLKELGASIEQRPPTISASGTYEFDETALLGFLGSIDTQAAFGITKDDENEIELVDVYSFIPSNASTPNPPAERARRNSTQLDLFDYGNNAGIFILSQVEQWGVRQNNIIKRFLEDPSDDYKSQDMEDLAGSFFKLGTDLEEMTSIPDPVKTAHLRLAARYKEIGEHTRAVAQAKNEEELVSAMLASNDASNAFVKDYITLADIFLVYEVTFSNTDYGRVFSFKPL